MGDVVTLHIYTARVSYGGADRLDVTRKSATGFALAFAPSFRLLGDGLAARRHIDAAERSGLALAQGNAMAEDAVRRVAEASRAEAWEQYRAAYIEEMRRSYARQRTAWGWLLTQTEQVTLVCYCTDATRCHRRVLAGLLAACGAVDCGERGDGR